MIVSDLNKEYKEKILKIYTLIAYKTVEWTLVRYKSNI